jgi:hypothetical protein
MADPRDILFCIATSAVLRSSHRFRIFGAIATTMRFATASPFSIKVVPDIPAATNLCSRLREAKVDVAQGQQMS